VSATLLFIAPSAEAQPIWPYRVAVLSPAPVFSDPTVDSATIRTPNLSYPAMLRELEQLLEADPRFEVVSDEAVRVAMSARVEQARSEYIDLLRDNGIEQFGFYEIESAIDTLEQAVAQYAEAHAGLTRPREVATAYEYLARAYLERAGIDPARATQSLTSARLAFKEMIRLDPTADMSPGLFPEPVVELFREVYIELMHDDGRELRLRRAGAAQFASLQALDYVIAPYFLRDSGGVRMVVHVYDAELEAAAFADVTRLVDDTALSRDRVSRAGSRFVACVALRREPLPPEQAVDAGALFLSAGWGFTFYGDKPTDEQFLNQGVALMLDYHFTENLGVYARSAVLFGSRDADGDLLDGFTSVRSSLGLMLSARYRWLRTWLGTGIEINRVGGFDATENFWCKVTGGRVLSFDGLGARCRPGDINSVDARTLMGAFLMPGLSFDIAPPFGLYLNGNFGFYLSDSAHVDFPLSGEAGIEYRF